MSAVLNDRDAILQAAATRIVNPKNADILLSQSAPAFHVTAGGAADVASITVSATLVGLEGAVSWSVQGATLSNVTDREATVTYANMQGTTAIVTASMMSSGATFAKSCVLATIQDGAPGSSAKTVKLTPSEQVFKISKAGAGSPASITLTATGQNTAGTPSFTIPVGTATLTAGSSAAQKVLTLANMTTDQVTIEVTLDGQKDRVTIYKVREGQDGQPGADGIVGLLNNESVNLPATDAGVVSSVAGAACTMKVYRGAADDSANWGYAFSPASAAASLQYTTSGGTLTVTGLAAGVDSAYVDITASRTGYASITKRFSVAKAKSGAGGVPGADARNLTLAASSQVILVAKNGTASPASVTLTSTAQTLAGTPTFAIISGTATLTGTGSTRSFTYASMTSDSVTIRVTQDGLTDTVTIIKLREGADGAAAITGMLSNEIVTLPASSAGVVSSFSGAVCSMKVYNGTSDDTANWTFAYAPASSTASLQYTTTTSGTVTVTGMSNSVDSAYVDITASRTGYTSITKRFSVTKSKAGASVTGARGAGTYYVVGSAWSDVAAQAACPGGPVVNDQVTISNGTVTYTKRWDGAAWNVPGAYLSGSLFVEGDINGSKLKAGTVQITLPDGTPVVTIGGLQPGFEAPGTKNSEQQWSDVQGIPYATILNNDDSVAMGFNPTFADWPTNLGRPTGWSGSTPIREAAIKRLGQWAIRFNTPGGTQVWINRRVTLPAPLPLGTFIAGTYDVYIDRIDATNTTGKPGLMVRLWWGTASGEYTDRHFPAAQTVGAWQRINFTARPATGKQILQIEFYLFGSFINSAYGGHFFGDVIFDNFRFALFDSSLDNTTISIGSDGTLGGAGGGQVTITGLGYTGALDATSDIKLVGRGVTVAGNILTKTAGSGSAWDADAYSEYGYVGGAFASASPATATYAIMFGLNADPLTNSSYTSLDYAFFLEVDGRLLAYESGVNRGQISTYVAGDVLTVAYDGSNVRYIQNGTVVRMVAATISGSLYFDSSFRSSGGSLTGVRFGPLSSNNWGSIGGTGKPQDNATVGAPTGTTVGGTEAGLVASRALNGDTALAAVNNATSGLASKLAAAGNQNLTGPVTLTSSGAIVVGTVNDGVRINTTGIIGRKAGYTTFSVAADGTALFGGTMTAVTGTFGKVELLSTGEVSGGNFVTKNPASEWPAAGTGPGFQIGNGALRLGNFNDGKYVFIGYDGNIIAPGLQLINGQLTLTSTVIVSPRVSQPIYDTFAYNALGGGFVSGPNGSLSNSVTLQITGNNGPHKIAWSYVRLAGGTPSAPSWADGSGDTFGVGATATNTTLSFKVSAVITGTDGRTLNYSDIFTLQFGTI